MLLSQCREMCDAQQMCLRPDACGKTPPEVMPGNQEAWSLYHLLRTQWHYAGLGQRARYDYLPLIELAKANDFSGGEIVDIVERVRIIEEASLEVDAQILAAERDRREMQEQAAQRLNRTPQKRSPRHRR